MSDLISRQAAIDALHMHLMYRMGTDSNKKRLDDWINGVPSVQPEKRTEERTKTHACDLIDREAAIRAVNTALFPKINTAKDAEKALRDLPSAQPENIRCAECKWFQCNMRQDGYLPKGVDEFECRHWCGYCDPTDFCSYAERRTDE